MLLELYPRVHRRYTSLPIIGPTLDGYGTWLLKQGYSTDRTREYFRAVPRLARQLRQRGVRSLSGLTRAGCWPVRRGIRRPIPISRRWCVNWIGISTPSCRCFPHER